MRDIPHHLYPMESIGHNFTEELRPNSKPLFDAIAQRYNLSKIDDEIEAFLNLMSSGNQDHSEQSRLFTSKYKITGKLELDDMSSISNSIVKLCAIKK